MRGTRTCTSPPQIAAQPVSHPLCSPPPPHSRGLPAQDPPSVATAEGPGLRLVVPSSCRAPQGGSAQGPRGQVGTPGPTHLRPASPRLFSLSLRALLAPPLQPPSRSWWESCEHRRLRTLGPWETCLETLASRITVHLIGCPAPPVNSIFLLWLQTDSCVLATCKVLKSWHCKDPQGLSPFFSYRCEQLEPKRGRKFHNRMAELRLGPRHVTLSSAPAAT